MVYTTEKFFIKKNCFYSSSMNDGEFINYVPEKFQIFHPMYLGHARSCQFNSHPPKKTESACREH